MMKETASRTASSRPRQVMIEAAREFNRGRYFEAHEVLEGELEELPDELWDLFLGLIQISVGYHKLEQGLLVGGARMLARGLEKVEGLEADFGGLRLDLIRDRARADRDSLDAWAFDDQLFRSNPPRLQPLP